MPHPTVLEQAYYCSLVQTYYHLGLWFGPAIIRQVNVTKCDNIALVAVLKTIVQGLGAIPAAPRKLITMGIIADTFQQRIEEMKQRDDESIAELNRILIRLKSIANQMDELIQDES